MKWYVVQAKPRRENDVCRLLKQGGFETFYPVIKDLMYRSTTSFFRTAPLFPSYLFVHTDFGEDRNFHLVKYTRGVNKVITFENRPVPMSDEIIQTIRSHANDNGIIERQTFLKRGDRIRVRKGMLKELIGIIEKPVPACGRVQVLLKLINYEMHATVHWTEVEKLKVA
ncbi:MAG: hypothetical protein HYU99_03340 [Deltaproteobacteria bacterium]|nr:hypothetical protein [Deltaproteobacteria bacterium]